MLLDILGTLLSLLSTFYFIRMDKKAWVITLFAAGINGALYFSIGLIGYFLLECYYFINACYGFYCWNAQDSDSSLKLKHYSYAQYTYLSLVFILLFFGLHYTLYYTTSLDSHHLDALATSLSVIAQWLMCKKIISTWVLWFIADALFAVIFFEKQLFFHMTLMVIYTGLAVAGYVRWSAWDKNLKPLVLSHKI